MPIICSCRWSVPSRVPRDRRSTVVRPSIGASVVPVREERRYDALRGHRARSAIPRGDGRSREPDHRRPLSRRSHRRVADRARSHRRAVRRVACSTSASKGSSSSARSLPRPGCTPLAAPRPFRGHIWVAIAAAVAASVLLTVGYAVLLIRFRANQIVAGLAVWFVGLGSHRSSPRCCGARFEGDTIGRRPFALVDCIVSQRRGHSVVGGHSMAVVCCVHSSEPSQLSGGILTDEGRFRYRRY